MGIRNQLRCGERCGLPSFHRDRERMGLQRVRTTMPLEMKNCGSCRFVFPGKRRDGQSARPPAARVRPPAIAHRGWPRHEALLCGSGNPAGSPQERRAPRQAVFSFKAVKRGQGLTCGRAYGAWIIGSNAGVEFPLIRSHQSQNRSRGRLRFHDSGMGKTQPKVTRPIKRSPRRGSSTRFSMGHCPLS